MLLITYHKRFSEGCQIVGYNKCPECPSTSRTEENVEKYLPD